jgi:phage major head subunit gpT-like protein
MLLNRENLNALSRSLRALVFQAREEYRPFWNRIALESRTEGRVGIYTWLEDFPTMREWKGERQVQNLSLKTINLENADWEMTFAIARKDVEDDLLDHVGANAREYAFRWAQHDDYLVTQLLLKGFSAQGPDGANFFGTHRVGKKNYQNAGTAPLTRESFRAALANMRSLQDSRGYPLGFFLDRPLLIVGPQLAPTATEIVGVQTLPNGGPTPTSGRPRSWSTRGWWTATPATGSWWTARGPSSPSSCSGAWTPSGWPRPTPRTTTSSATTSLSSACTSARP